ncbi:MAG TPA: sigma-70 family RNA polymerase sigma factor [Acidobacteria bacterium]|nr:sigma-70 family RNA polymerase sigma factor [Acidobacteriota bacterium]
MSSQRRPEEITVLLGKWSDGDRQARDAVMQAVYGELCVIAHRHLDGEFGSRTLNTSDLVHELYLKLSRTERIPSRSRAQFFGIAARQMRQILVDRARSRCAQKRGGGARLETLDEGRLHAAEQARNLLDVDRALERLAADQPRAVRVVEMRFFAGMTMAEIAEAVGTSLATVERDWTVARAWLMRELAGPR